ncbi:testis-specific Y-encoded-like protein 2 isoform X1 [Callithrix jacchus]|uniref:Testis-specific Y-encoded-like protein 2 n=1 Tax=Callithrix jacchus TaxID=9483 RepID=F7IFH4_CALJA|nr:testis-specific Y-encoded-like protein 2 isoform X1 [Callithrix jacchus]
MDRPDEGPPAKTRRLSSSESPERDQPPPPPPPPPPPLLRLPLPPPEQRPRLQEETEAAQVLADMRGLGLGPALPPPPPYVILEEGGIRAYFTLGAGCPGWDPTIESGYGEAPPPTESLEVLPTPEVPGGSLEIDFQVVESSSFGGEGALETCSAVGWGPQRLIDPKSKEEAIIIVEDDDEDEQEGKRSSRRRRRRRRRRKQRKVKREGIERDAERMESILQALEDIQLDLEAVNIKAGKAFLRLKRKFIQMRRPFLERRDLIIQHIPGFWVKAFLNHPRISILINRRDEDIFRYLTNLQVQDLRHISMGYKMKLYFQTNPYFTNMVIVKEFQRNRSGRLVSHSTPIRWHRGQEPQARRRGNQDASHSFFSWFSNHSLPEADRIAEIIKNDLWVNPLRYYLRERGSRTKRKRQEMKKRKTKDRCEVVIMEDAPDYYAVEDIFSDISDIDETIHDIKISDFMETTDYFETTDNEVTDINENIFDSESPDHNEAPNNETTDNNESADDNETTDNNESADDNNENPEDNNKNTDDNKENPDDNKNTYGNNFFKGGIWGSHGNNQDSSDSDNEADEDSDDEDNDGNEGDNEGSDDDGNEGDNEGSDDDDDDRDVEYYEKVIEDLEKEQHDYTDVIEIISDESVEEEEGIEEGIQQDDIYEEEGIEAVWEEGEDSDDSDVEEVVQIPNGWANPGKRGKTG